MNGSQLELVEAMVEVMRPSDAPDDDGAFTTLELMAALGVSRRTVLQTLRDLKSAGRLKVIQTRRMNLVDRMVPTPGYVLIDDLQEE